MITGDEMGDQGVLREYYDHYWAQIGQPESDNYFTPLVPILERHTRRSDDCIDVGCGRGDGAGAWVAHRAASYMGVDISAEALTAARSAGLDVTRVSDAAHLPFADGSFDLAICIEVLEHLFAPQRAMAEIHRVLRPGGRVIATVPNVAHWRRRADLAVVGRWNPLGDDDAAHRPWRDPHLRFFAQRNLRALLVETGFDPIEVGGHGLTWMVDIPGLRRMTVNQQPGPIYRRLVAWRPSLFAHHLHVVGAKRL